MKNDTEIHVRLPKEQKNSWRIKAAQSNLNLSSWVIALVEKGKVVAPLSASELKLLRDFSGAANNVNQIAKKLNQLNTDKISIAVAKDVIAKMDRLLEDFQKQKQQTK